MVVDVTPDGKKATMKLTDRLDTVSAPAFEKVFMKAIYETDEVIVDCERLTFISSAGLRVFMSGQKTVNKIGSSLTLVNVPQEVKEVFSMTGISGMLTIK